MKKTMAFLDPFLCLPLKFAVFNWEATDKEYQELPALDSTRFFICVSGHFDQMHCQKKYCNLF